MSRKTAATKPARTRKTATAEPAVQMSPREKELSEKYKHQAIVPGSWRQAGHPDRPGWGSKVTVQVACKMEGCTSTRTLATSDLQWTTTCYCDKCVKIIKANRRATKAEKKKLK